MKKKKIKNKHNKKRNTAFVYEALISEIAKASMQNDKKTREKVLSIVKKYFSKGKPLHNELMLYKALLETKCRDYNIATRFLNEVKQQYSVVVANEDLYTEQGELIKSVNKEAPEAFKNFVPNYKNLASIYQIFNNKVPVKSRVIFEEKFVEGLCKIEKKDDNLEQIDSLTYKFFLEKFNKQYGISLLEAQKKVLTYYIMSFADDSMTLKSYLNEEVGRLKKAIIGSKEIEEDKDMKTKSEKILEFLDSFKKNHVDENMIQRVLEIQSLADEILSEGETNEN